VDEVSGWANGAQHAAPLQSDGRAKARRYVILLGSREINLGFGFDDEEGVGVGVAGGAEFLAGFVEGVG